MSRDSIIGLMALSFTFGLGMVAPVVSIGLTIAGLDSLVAIPISLAVGLFAAIYSLEHNWFGTPR